ncbi:branched-chain amino acid ABC transporter permease [Ruegeria sp. HKCCD8929]|uniref:branched-chain amino acid ABC transporter permease n=1 Tax=Ruegeria sp. HKCCD8929 TaxID=2683006 RepID=UPI001489DE84|nr:branched-chain amino acid ABC transporter permease [Ruegeria sp. HKCCD8929]
MDWINAILQGILLGGLYALFAAGLSLMFGVMRFVNVAHGDFIVISAYGALIVVAATGVHPLWATFVVVPGMALLGYVGQRILLNRTLGEDILPPLLVTFGFSIIIQNVLLEVFSADSQKLQAGWMETASIPINQSISIGVMPLLIFASALIVIAGLQAFFYKTSLGRVLRATSDDQDTVRLMGANNAKIFGYATAIASAVVGIAGVYLAMRTNFDPSVGPARLLFAFEAVIIGGLGNLWGTLAGGIILGVAQAIGAQIDPGFQILAGHLAFLILLVVKPQGLFPKMKG